MLYHCGVFSTVNEINVLALGTIHFIVSQCASSVFTNLLNLLTIPILLECCKVIHVVMKSVLYFFSFIKSGLSYDDL